MIGKKVVRISLFIALVAFFAIVSVPSEAAPIPVTNGDFETAPPDPNLDGDNNYSTGDVTPPWNGDNNYLESTNEAFTNPSGFVSGWQSNGPAGENAKYGLQQPRSGTGTNQLFYQRTEPAGTVPTGTLTGAFNGNLIGFVNMDDADGFNQEIQSATVGNLSAGTYKLNVAVGARANQNWNDIKYDIMLVANPTNGDGTNANFGSSGGTVLGTPATTTMAVLGTMPDTTNIQDLQYMLNVPAGDPNLGAPFAIRILTNNALTQNGVEDPGASADPPNARFTQGNFDNVRLDFVAIPEPGTVALFITAALFGAASMRRRNR
jgi:hypothetical protein